MRALRPVRPHPAVATAVFARTLLAVEWALVTVLLLAVLGAIGAG